MVNPILVKDFRKLKEDWDNAAKTDYFRDYIAQGFNEETAFRESGRKWTEIIKQFLNKFSISWKNKVVTEVGAGAGRMTEFIAQEAKLVNALDISAEMIKRLYQRLGKSPKINTGVIIRDFSILADLETDIIISYLVFQHTPEEMVERLIQDGKRILKKGGYYFFQIPLSQKHKCAPCNNAPAVDMVWWTLEEVKELARKYNFNIIYAPSYPDEGQYFIFQKP